MIKIRNNLTILILISCILTKLAYGDEGTDDVDFDYLPPEEIGVVGQFTVFVTELFTTPSHPISYNAAKRLLYRKIGDTKTFYCGCPADLTGRKFEKTACGYVPRNDNARAHRIEAEHVLPAFWIAEFKKGDSCWVKQENCGSARECCLENDEMFKAAHNDLVNLIPSIGELNADRSNYLYKLIDGEDRGYGNCDYEVDTSNKTMEPHPDIRGDISRIYFYMRDTYDLEFPDDLIQRLVLWNEADPISSSEVERNKRIKDTQGTSNTSLE